MTEAERKWDEAVRNWTAAGVARYLNDDDVARRSRRIRLAVMVACVVLLWWLS